MSQSDRNWRSLYPIWMKYCGVCDEYRSLKSKWNYITSIRGLTALPKMQSTFERMDKAIDDTDKLFKPMFDRAKRDNPNNVNPNEVEDRLNELQDRFYSITHYFGILKLILFQRTVSFEIPEMISGLPVSPERTIGNEAIYLASDRVCERYLNCLNFDPELHWDGAVSFVHPIQMHWFGGLSWPDRYLKHFHVVLSEENKHFLGAMIILAHELSHATHVKFRNHGTQPNWFESMWRKIISFQREEFLDRLEEFDDRCKKCSIWNYLSNLLTSTAVNVREFREFVADLLAFLIGGPMTVMSVIDLALDSANVLRYSPLRPAFVLGYCSQLHLEDSFLFIQNAILEMAAGWQEYLPISFPFCPFKDDDAPTPCYELQLRIGERSGKLFAYYDSKLLSDLRTELPVEKVEFPPGVTSITTAIVKEKFSISGEIEDRICRKLIDKQCCPDEDPRYIMHCYYKLFLEGTKADYSTTLYSLAYNTFR
ncbi:MAG: hypothetical protein ACFFCD_16590 [Promethearchaeota archaeon]